MLGLALLIAIGDAILVLRAPPKSPIPVVTDKIGLAVIRDGDGLRVEWNRHAGTVRRATDAMLYIQDGKHQSQLNLDGKQLTGSSVRYWPETENIQFRLEVHNGTASVSDEVRVAAERAQIAPRAVVERVRPSPFKRTRPEVVRHGPARPAAPENVVRRDLEPVHRAGAEARHRESGWAKVVGKIPLLRRLKKHPQTTDSQSVHDTEPRR